jgi:uncharacterized membrane protein YiaA
MRKFGYRVGGGACYVWLVDRLVPGACIPTNLLRTVMNTKPSNAFIAASWVALLAGMAAFIVGLWNAQMALNEKGYYFTVLLYGLFSAVSLQKTVRDQMEGVPVTGIYYSLSWFSTLMAVALLLVGLWNATLTLSEKGFYGMSFLLALFGAIAVQKNTRDSRTNSSPL